MTGLCIFEIFGLSKVSHLLSVFMNLSYADVSVLSSFLWYINSDYFVFCPASQFLPHQVLFSQEDCIMACIMVLTWVSCISLYLAPIIFVQIMEHLHIFYWFYHFPFRPLNIPFYYDSLGLSIVKLYISLIWLYVYPTIMSLYVLSVIYFSIFSLSVTYVICPKYENKPIIFGLSP